ncbi:unnamed protein product, partial [Ectocarpus fasciculatus]
RSRILPQAWLVCFLHTAWSRRQGFPFPHLCGRTLSLIFCCRRALSVCAFRYVDYCSTSCVCPVLSGVVFSGIIAPFAIVCEPAPYVSHCKPGGGDTVRPTRLCRVTTIVCSFQGPDDFHTYPPPPRVGRKYSY